MKFRTSVGATVADDHNITMTVKADAGALNYGDVVVIDATNNDVKTGVPSVKTIASADSTIVCGVISQVGGIPKGGVGDMTVFGIAEVNVASATSNFVAGATLTTSTTAGAAATGTPTVASILGKVWYSPNDTTTVLFAWINVG